MGILNVDNIQPVGGGTTITLNSSEINVGAGITFESNGQAIYAGVTTFASNINLGGDIIHSGDNTKIRFPANDTITFETSGSEKLRITSNGKVGIGTINPQQLLEVQDRSGGTLIGLSVGTQYGNAGFGGYNNYPAIMNNVANPLIYCDTNNDRTIFFGDTVGFGTTCAFRVNGAERLRIGSSGQIGVAGANYGTAGQVLTSQGSGSAVQWATPSSGAMTLLATMTTNMSANTLSQSLNLTGYHKLMGTVTGLQRSGGLNDTWFGFNNLTASGSFSWVRHYLDNSNDTSTNRQGTSTGYAYGSVGPGFFLNGAGFAGADSGNNDAEFTVHNLQDGGRKIFEMHARSYLVRNIVINTTGSINTTNAISSFEVHVAQASHRLTGGTIKLYGFK